MFTPIKATAISLKPKKWDKDFNADKLEALFRAAAQDRPDLIVATEGVLEAEDVSQHRDRVSLLDKPHCDPGARRLDRDSSSHQCEGGAAHGSHG